MENTWKFWGRLETGEGVYVKESGELAIERDYQNLVEPKPREKQEIYHTWPGLIDRVEDKRGAFPIENVVDTGALRDNIKYLVAESLEREKVIDALKTANVEKGERYPGKAPEIKVIELTGDIAVLEIEVMEMKNVIDALKTANKEKDGLICSLMADIVELNGRIIALQANLENLYKRAGALQDKYIKERDNREEGEYSKKE